ncbi:MAG: hypothetical protein ACRBG0_13810 [Lewinella sp.]|jgi:hypothetical protein|uniref:hypothetical protein n=1 Tax=Lewinella sp. TaxID=2004506 RepID=UPI003D6B198F
MKNIWKLLGLLSLVFSLTTCDLINPEEEVPAYLEINDFSLTTQPGAQGSDDELITEVWVFVDGTFLGMYDLPALVPVLKAGPTEIRLEAGIRDNGIASFPDIYPFYEPYKVTLDLKANETAVINPSTSYLSEAKFAFIEDFEDNRPRVFTELVAGNTELERTQDDVFEGNYSGRFALSREYSPVVEIATSSLFSGLQEGGVYVYLEVNYKSDAPVVWGFVGDPDPIAGPLRFYDPGFSAKNEWNKIYFNLSQLLFNTEFDEYQVGFQAFLLEESPDSSTILLDNIKLVHF